MKQTLCLALLLSPILSLAQPSTDVWLLDLDDTFGNITLSNPVNVSQNLGLYDNQPAFLPDGSGILYARTEGEHIQVARYLIESQETTLLTNSPGGKFSPTPTPDGYDFSTIILEEDGTQLLQRYTITGSEGPSVVINDVVIGYHTWVNDTTLFAFVLGDTMTLQRCYTTSQTCEVVDQNIGRSLHIWPLNGSLLYVSKADSASWKLAMMSPFASEGRTLGLTFNNTEDFACRGNGSLFKTERNQLFRWRPGEDEVWQPVADLREHGIEGTLSRLAISPEGDKIAIVATEPSTE